MALCFYGLVGSVADKNGQGISLDPSIAHRYYKENILDLNNEVDIFIHSWSINSKEELVELYNPKKFIIESQVSFPDSKKHPSIKGSFFEQLKMGYLKLFKRNNYFNKKEIKEKEAFRAYSRWYSVKQSIQLMRNYELDNGFHYDCVMSTRLDIAFFKPVVFKKFDMNFFYASNWNDSSNRNEKNEANKLNRHKGKGFLDFWFFSNTKTMYLFSKLFDDIEHYSISPHSSSYQHLKTITCNVKYVYYRWFDHEMIRRKFFNSKK